MLKIYWMLKKQYLKTQMEYRLNFCLMMIAGVVIRTLFMAITYIIFNSIPSIGGYDRNEVFLMFALFFISEGLGGIFYEGLWSIPSMAHNGELDMMLVRPVSPLVQILSNGFGLQGIGTLALGITALLLSSAQIAWFRSVLYLCLPVFILLGMVVRLSSYLLSASHVFFLRVGDRANVTYTLNSLGGYARYPVSIYPGWMQAVLFTIIPYGFIGYLPVCMMKNGSTLAGMAGIALAAGLLFWLARTVFYQGLKRYESMGM
ncbi:MAG: ABC-2 family transporter protein [Clostridia bacterium]|nr:ABC-2 family transporter protein [Clostridia bacterium]